MFGRHVAGQLGVRGRAQGIATQVKLNAARHSCKQTYPDSLDQKLMTALNTELAKTWGGLASRNGCQLPSERQGASRRCYCQSGRLGTG